MPGAPGNDPPMPGERRNEDVPPMPRLGRPLEGLPPMPGKAGGTARSSKARRASIQQTASRAKAKQSRPMR
eukprot:762441-Alexandrium_andersonii.AAC.1